MGELLTGEIVANLKMAAARPWDWHLDKVLGRAAVRLEAQEAELERLRAERDALMGLIVRPWTRDGDGAAMFKINLAWWDSALTREAAEAMVWDKAGVRKAAGLDG